MSRIANQESTSKQWKEIRKCRLWMDDNQCLNCGSTEDTANGFDVHHIEPVDAGGSDRLENLRTLCVRCHKHIHKLEPVGEEYPLKLLEGEELPIRAEPQEPESNTEGLAEVGAIHQRSSWLVPADTAIIRFVYAVKDERGEHTIMTPKTISLNTGYSNRHIGNRCRTLARNDLLERIDDNAYYRITDRGKRLLDGGVDPQELEESDGRDPGE